MKPAAPRSAPSWPSLWLVSFIAALLSISTVAEAHVRVTPRESKASATETYTARVPTEGKVTTTSVQLDVPEGVAIVSASAPGGTKYEFIRAADRIVGVTWTVEIKPGEALELGFVARNPSTGDEIVWKVHQRYADGTSSEWVGPAGTQAPAPVTKLIAAQ